MLLQVIVYENGKEKALFNVLEEVKDIELIRPHLFTVRDLDITVTEIHPGKKIFFYFSAKGVFEIYAL